MPAQEAPPAREAEREPDAADQPPRPEPTEPPEAQPEPPAEPQPAPRPAGSPIITTPATIGQPVEPPSQPSADHAAGQPPPAEAPPEVPAPSAAEPPPEPSAPPAQAPTPPSTAPPATAEPPPKKKSKAWLWACGGCGCLVLLVVAILGALLFVGVREEAREAPVASTGQDEEVVEEASPAEEVATDHYEVTLPSGWSRDSDPDDDVLAVSGPEVNGEQLSLLIWVEELSAGTSLQQFSDRVLERYRDAPWAEDTTEASLCDEPARRVALTTDDHDYLIYISVYKAQGFVIVMIAPEGTMGEQESTFDQVLGEFAMYE